MPAGGRHKKAITVEEIAFFLGNFGFYSQKNTTTIGLDWETFFLPFHIVLLVITTGMVGSSGL